MFKKAMLLAVAVAALAALVVPATASAIWSKTVGPNIVHLETDAQAQVTGQAKFQGQVGSVECQTVSTATFIAGTTTGTATFDVDNGGQANDEEKCSVGGGLVSLGCTDVEQVTVSGSPFEIHAEDTTTIDVTTDTIQNHLTGGIFCPKTLQLTPGTVGIKTHEDWWHQGTLEGTLKLHSPAGEQQVTISGTGTVSPATTYGIT